MLQQKLDQPVSGPSSPRNSQAMIVDGSGGGGGSSSSSEVAEHLVQSIQALKAEVSRLHGLLRASQVERTCPGCLVTARLTENLQLVYSSALVSRR